VAFTYALATVATRALDKVRALIRDTKNDRMFLQDEEISALLADRGLVAASDPVGNRPAVYLTAAEAARMIQAKFASESEIALTAVGPLKQNAAGAYARLAAYLEAAALTDAAPQFVDPQSFGADSVHPSGYENDWVAGVDPVPGL
jgi:hypothetical protein